MKGKDKCKILKEIRAQIAAANEIEWVTDNCTHKGDCRGTCPKCEAEVAVLEKALARRRALGKTVAVAGLSAGMIVTTAMTTSCELIAPQTTDGDMVVSTEQSERTKRTTTTETDEVIEIDGDMAPPRVEFMGDLIPRYYYTYTDFDLTEPRLYEVICESYAEGVVTDEAVDPYPEDTFIPVGDHFEVVGELAEEDLLLIRYEDAYYCLYGSELEHCALDVTEGLPDVVD